MIVVITASESLGLQILTSRYYYKIWPSCPLIVYTLFTFQMHLRKICVLLKISFFFVLPYFFSSYGFVSRSSPLPVSLTCYTRKFGPLTRKTKSPAPEHAINIDDTAKNS